MIRRLLPLPSHLPLLALDAALLRGDVLLAREVITDLSAPDQVNMDARRQVALRAGALSYLANEMDAARRQIGGIQSDADAGSTLVAASWLLAALTHIDQRNENEARTSLSVAQEHYQGDPLASAFCQLASTTLVLYLGHYERAARSLAQLRLQFEGLGDSWGRWQVVRLLGLAAHQRSAYADALENLTSARQGFAALGDLYEVARCDKALANTYRRLSRATEALFHARQSLDYFEAQALVIPAARCHNALGSIQLQFDQMADAMTSFRTAAVGFQQAGLDVELASVLHNLGLYYRLQGQFRPALAALARAAAIAADRGVRDVEAAMAEQQAHILRHLGQTDEALAQLRAASDIFTSLGAHSRAAVCWLDRANLMLEGRRYDEARPLIVASLALFTAEDDDANLALAEIGLARLHLTDGQPGAAISLLAGASHRLLQQRHIRQAARADLWRGAAHLDADQPDEAASAFQQALAGAAEGSFDIAWHAAAGLAAVAQRRADEDRQAFYLDEAITFLNRLRATALSPQTAASISQESLSVYRQAIATALARGDPDHAFAILENQKALQLAQQFAAIRFQSEQQSVDWQLPSPPRPDLDPARHIAARLDELRKAVVIPAEGGDLQRLSRLEMEYQHLTETLAAYDAPYAVLYQPPPLRVRQLRARLDDRHGARQWGCLSFGWMGDGPEVLHRFWLDSERLLASPMAMNRLHHRLVALACRPEPSYRRHLLDWETPATATSEWRQLQELLVPADFSSLLEATQTLYISPSGPLAAFPFAALVIGNQFLGLRCSFSQTPSLPLLEALLLRSPQSSPPSALAETRALICAVSNPSARPDAPALLAASREADALAAVSSPDSLLLRDEQASASRLRQLEENGRLADFALLHFGLHALLNPYHSHLSRLLLWDDDLFIADILRWRLHARLVVLAACDTAVGHSFDGDEQMGLPHAFLLAGADALLASLQPVADEAATAFMAAFYGALAADGVSPAQALQSARRQVAALHPSPFSWSAFTLVGLM